LWNEPFATIELAETKAEIEELFEDIRKFQGKVLDELQEMGDVLPDTLEDIIGDYMEHKDKDTLKRDIQKHISGHIKDMISSLGLD
jgi:hypothetical protein